MIEEPLIKVGMADLNIADSGAILKTTGLGSCVGVDAVSIRSFKSQGWRISCCPPRRLLGKAQLNMAKYADTAIPELCSNE